MYEYRKSIMNTIENGIQYIYHERIYVLFPSLEYYKIITIILNKDLFSLQFTKLIYFKCIYLQLWFFYIEENGR